MKFGKIPKHSYDQSVWRAVELFRGIYSESDHGVYLMAGSGPSLREKTNLSFKPKNPQKSVINNKAFQKENSNVPKQRT